MSLSGHTTLRNIVTRTDPVELRPVAPPPSPAGTRDVSLSKAGESAGDFATLRDLKLSGSAESVSVPPGTYGSFTASGKTGFVFGVSGSTQPSIYNLRDLTLSGQAQLQAVGPVILTVAAGVKGSGSSVVGANANPGWLFLRVSSGPVHFSGDSSLSAIVLAPSSEVRAEGKSRIVGTVSCAMLVLKGGLLKVTVANQAPVVNAGPARTITLPTNSVESVLVSERRAALVAE